MEKRVQIVRGHKTLKVQSITIQDANTNTRWKWDEIITDKDLAYAIAYLCGKKQPEYQGHYRGKVYAEYIIDDAEILNAKLQVKMKKVLKR